MAYRLIRAEERSDVSPAASAVLSIRLRPDGFSFATARTVAGVVFADGTYAENLHEALGGLIADEPFDTVRASLPTAEVVPVPAEYCRAELFGFLWPDATARGRVPVGIPCGEAALAMTVPTDLDALFAAEYASRFAWQHPLSVSLGYADTGSVLRIDTAADRWFACLTLKGALAAAESLPLENEASLLLGINRLIVLHKVGTLRIVCSGERCDDYAAALAAYYPDVSIDPLGADRDILRLSR